MFLFGKTQIKGRPLKHFTAGFERGSGLSCVAGTRILAGMSQWSDWSTCPPGHNVVGVQALKLSNMGHADHPRDAEIDHYHCDHRGCRARCRKNGELTCVVVARCCTTQTGPLKCYNSEYHDQKPNIWGEPAFCDWKSGYRATGFGRLNLLNSQPSDAQAVSDFYVGWHYARALCSANNSGRKNVRRRKNQMMPACAVQARCCKPNSGITKLHCVHGTKALGAPNQWSQWSVCPPFYTAIGTMRISTLSTELSAVETNSVAKHECKSDTANDFEGCRGWAFASAHNVWAKCCRVIGDDRELYAGLGNQ